MIDLIRNTEAIRKKEKTREQYNLKKRLQLEEVSSSK